MASGDQLTYWEARYEGTCPINRDSIRIGDPVVRLPLEDGGEVVHAQCAADDGWLVDWDSLS